MLLCVNRIASWPLGKKRGERSLGRFLLRSNFQYFAGALKGMDHIPRKIKVTQICFVGFKENKVAFVLLSLNRFSLFQKCSVKKLTPALWNNTTRTVLKRATGSTAIGKFRQYRRQGRNRWARVPSGTSLYWDNATSGRFRHFESRKDTGDEVGATDDLASRHFIDKRLFIFKLFPSVYDLIWGDEFIFSFEAVILVNG